MRLNKIVTAAVLAGAFLALTPVKALAWDHHEDRGRGGYYQNGPGGYYNQGYYGGNDGRREYFEHMRHEQWERQQSYYGYQMGPVPYGYYGYYGGGDGDGDGD